MPDAPATVAQDSPRGAGSLTLFDAVCIVVGTIIGAGVFQMAPDIAVRAGSIPVLVLLWLAGGVLSIAGGLCFAEMAGRFGNQTGGDWVYLRAVFGQWLAFLFAWAAFWVIRPANIGAMGLTFSVYAGALTAWPLIESGHGQVLCTIACIGVLTLVNLAGLRMGARLLRVLTVLKVIGVTGIALLGLTATGAVDPPAARGAEADAVGLLPRLALAMVFVMYAYGGWNDVAFVTAEVRRPERNVLRALLTGTLVVTALYLLLNAGFARTLGIAGMSGSKAVAADMIATRLAGWGPARSFASAATSALICVACLSAINAMLITSPRILFAALQDWPGVAAWLGGRAGGSAGKPDAETPHPQRLMAFCLMGTSAVTTLLLLVSVLHEDVVATLITVTAPWFWGMLGLVPVAMILLRWRHGRPAGYAAPLFPLPPVLLILSCGWMAWSAVQYAILRKLWFPALAVIALMAVGVAVSLFMPLRRQI